MMKENQFDYLISRLKNIVENAKAIKEVIEKDNKISSVYFSEKIDSIEENVKQIKEMM